MKKDIYFMDKAILQAKKAAAIDEVPIGAILVDRDGKIIARGFNQIEKRESQIAHAEIIVLQKASKKVKEWRLLDTTLYVTVQPCMMCLGALYLSRVSRIVYGIESLKFGVNEKVCTSQGIYKNLSTKIENMNYEKVRKNLADFFKKRRRSKDVQESRNEGD